MPSQEERPNQNTREQSPHTDSEDSATGDPEIFEDAGEDHLEDSPTKDPEATEQNNSISDKSSIPAPLQPKDKETDDTLTMEKADLIDERKEIPADKNAPKSDLSESKPRKEENSKELNDALSDAAAAKLEVDFLTAEIKKLSEENEVLRMRISEKDDVEKKLANLTDDWAAANGKIEGLQTEVSSMKTENEQLVIQLKEARLSLGELQHAMACKQEELEGQIASLEIALKDASLALQTEEDSKENLASMLGAAHLKSKDLEENLDQVKSSLSRNLEDASRSEKRISSLESNVATLVEEKRHLEQAKGMLEDEVKKLNLVSQEAANKTKLELNQLNEKVRQLEFDLDKANEATKHWEQKISVLQVDRILFEKKCRLVRLALPAAAVSTSTLAVVGVLAFLRRAKLH